MLRVARLFLLPLALAAATSAAAEDDAQIWLGASTSGMIAEKIHLNIDGNLRFEDSGDKFSQTQQRVTLSYQPVKGVRLGGGYSHTHKSASTEHRGFLQASYPLFDLGNVEFTGRTRLEMRDISNLDGLKYRARQQIKAAVPLQGPKGLQAVIHSEMLILLNAHSDDPSGINQLRTFAGLNIPVIRNFELEAGYLNQTEFEGENAYNHTLSLTLNHKF